MLRILLFSSMACAICASAEGFGVNATGGRGGDVYVVTNLDSSGPGSFYQDVTTIPSSGRTNITGGTAIQSGEGGKLVRFTASKTEGRGGFLFTVTDADGSKWTQQFAICVIGS